MCAFKWYVISLYKNIFLEDTADNINVTKNALLFLAKNMWFVKTFICDISARKLAIAQCSLILVHHVSYA